MIKNWDLKNQGKWKVLFENYVVKKKTLANIESHIAFEKVWA